MGLLRWLSHPVSHYQILRRQSQSLPEGFCGHAARSPKYLLRIMTRSATRSPGNRGHFSLQAGAALVETLNLGVRIGHLPKTAECRVGKVQRRNCVALSMLVVDGQLFKGIHGERLLAPGKLGPEFHGLRVLPPFLVLRGELPECLRFHVYR